MAKSNRPSPQTIAIAILACVLILAPDVETAITCQQVATGISGCVAYARNGGEVPPACCIGVRNLKSAAKITPDRQQTCTCLKSIVRSIPGVKMDLVSRIPGRCGVNIGYPITLSVDCSKVK